MITSTLRTHLHCLSDNRLVLLSMNEVVKPNIRAAAKKEIARRLNKRLEPFNVWKIMGNDTPH